MNNKKRKPVIPPPSLQPRKTTKKAIPGVEKKEIKQVVEKPQKVAKTKEKPVQKENKERFTLWLTEKTYNAFKIHTATRKGSGSDYIEYLIKKDLSIK